MKNSSLIILFSCLNFVGFSQKKILLESVRLSDIDYKITLDSIEKAYDYNEIGITKTKEGLEKNNESSSILYTIEKGKINMYFINKSLVQSDKKAITNSDFDSRKPYNSNYLTISDIYLSLKYFKSINDKEAIISDTLKSTIENIIPKNFAYATIINTDKNIETIKNGFEYYSMFTKDNKLCPECKVVDTLTVKENITFVKQFLSTYCLTIPQYYLCDYDPHDAVAYYDKNNKMIALIEICFGCGDIYVENFETKKVHNFQMRDTKEISGYLTSYKLDNNILSPKLERLIHRRLLKDKMSEVEDLKKQFSERGLWFVR